jgi:hypothetical protein
MRSPNQLKVQRFLDTLVERRVAFSKQFAGSPRVQLPELPADQAWLNAFRSAEQTRIQSVLFWELVFNESMPGFTATFWEKVQHDLDIEIDWIACSIFGRSCGYFSFRHGDYLVQAPSGSLQVWAREQFEASRRF